MKEEKIPNIVYVLVFVVSCLVFPLFELVHRLPGQNLLNIGQDAAKDLEFNDLYYGTKANEYAALAPKHVVLVNIGCYAVGELRTKLIGLLPLVKSHDPATVGLDIHFSDTTDRRTDSELAASIRRNVQVLGKYRNEHSIFDTLAGISLRLAPVEVCATDGASVRQYMYEMEDLDAISPSFGRALYESYAHKSEAPPRDTEFMLEYVCTQNGYYDALGQNASEALEKDFPAVEASAFFEQRNQKKLDSLLSGKIVIVGWLGSGNLKNPYDIQDKFRVPVDEKLVDRLPIMPGAVIHACAVEMLLSDVRFSEWDGWRKFAANVAFLSLFYAGLLRLERIEGVWGDVWVFAWNLFFMLSFIYVAGILFMSLGIYYKVGDLLIMVPVLSQMLGLAKKHRSLLTPRKKIKKYLTLKFLR